MIERSKPVDTFLAIHPKSIRFQISLAIYDWLKNTDSYNICYLLMPTDDYRSAIYFEDEKDASLFKLTWL